jgi:hypothetical protein
MSSTTVQAINLEDEQITVLFNQHWFQEDINTLHKLLLKNNSNIAIKEVIIGADRENIRFHWLDTEFILNFECYSQSCWLEMQQPRDISKTRDLFNLLSKNHTDHV